MAKKEILSKLNLKDYNNELEEILEKKDFSSQVKNLLLSMFYKLEVGYKDYSTVKRDVISKEAFMESLMYIIKTKCNEIELVMPNEKEKPFTVYLEEGKIVCYQNEIALFHAILEMGDKKFFITEENQIWKQAVQKVVRAGYEIDRKELLTNFDGWAWNNHFNKMEDLDSYLAYQNLRILMGNSFVYNWKRDRRETKNYLAEVKKVSQEFWEAFCKFCLVKASVEKEEREYIQKILKESKEQLKKMENKSEFLKEIYAQKKVVSTQIKEFDKIFNDNDLLKEEFLKRNAEKPADKKIFSISDLDEMIQKERNNCMEKMQEYNNLLEPKNYLAKMKQLEEIIDFTESVKLSRVTEANIEEAQIHLQKAFLMAFSKRVEDSVTKKEMIELVYQYRYYLQLPMKENGMIKDVPELKEELTEVEKKVITKACKSKAITIINQDISYNFQIVQKILDTRIISLEEIFFVLSKEEEEIKIEIYEGEILDRTEKIAKEKEKDFSVKFQKKIKLFA